MCQHPFPKEVEVPRQKVHEGRIMKLLLETWREYLNEAHGLSKKDADYVKSFIDKTDDKEIKRILRFIVKSNVLVDKTQDVTKMKKEDAK